MIPIFHLKNRPADFFQGLILPLSAFRIILTTPKVLVLTLLSGLITAIALISLPFVCWPIAQNLSEHLIAREGTAWHAAQIGVGVIMFLVLFFISALTVPNVLLAPLQDPISEAVESKLGDFESPPFSSSQVARGIIESLKHTLFRLFFMMLGFFVLFPFNFVPVLGSVIWFLGSTLWSSFWLGVEHLSNPMARHFRSITEVVVVLRQRIYLALGFGFSLSIMLWIPLVNFFLMPVAIVMGTLMFRGLKACGSISQSAP